MKLGMLAKGAVLAAMASVALSACTAETGIVENSSLTVAWNQPMYSFNQNTSNGNATANAVILYMTQQWFNYYDDTQTLIRNEDFGTYELITQDPLVVKYTVNKDVTWSDGVKVDDADFLLHWGALSGNLNDPDADPQYDEETGQVIPGDAVYFDSVVIGGGIEQITQTPETSDDFRSITLTYDQVLVDWELIYSGGMMPAHVVGQRALGIEDPQDAKDAVVKAILDKDEAALVKIANVWNTDFDITSMPEDPSLMVGTGAYVVTDFVQDEFITLKARGADYKAGIQPKVESITVRWIPDALASVQALENGEVSITLPQATSDVLAAAQGVEGVTVVNQPGATYEHIDLVFNKEGGAFNPATYGGDEETAKVVRQAFLTALDVNEVLDKLIRPLQPNAEWDQSQVFLPGAPGYDESVAANGSEVYGQGDAAAAKEMLESVDITDPIDVCFLFSSTNTRRANEYQLYAEQVAPAGFNLVDCSSEDWGSLLGSGTYDASLFGWQSTSTAVTASDPTFNSAGGNNFTGYANSEVDDLYAQLKVEFDPATQKSILGQIDKLLWDDAYGMTVFQFPEVMVYDSALTNVSSSPLSPNFFWNFWEWEAPSAKASS
jgi:peptide/nickel transport system substrate-binding protein